MSYQLRVRGQQLNEFTKLVTQGVISIFTINQLSTGQPHYVYRHH